MNEIFAAYDVRIWILSAKVRTASSGRTYGGSPQHNDGCPVNESDRIAVVLYRAITENVGERVFVLR